MPEFFAGIDVGEVDFDDGEANGGHGIAQGDGGVRISARVEEDAGGPSPRVVQGVDQGAFAIGLVGADFDAEFAARFDEAGVDVREGEAPVDFRFAGAEDVEVGAVEEEEGGHGGEGVGGKGRKGEGGERRRGVCGG